ncbi:hypothetical protein ON010_g6860 [Phytophthora cinnamomi]|nr:hypothetical protein ON010_g6860 [Phytophthora cinnamomi]
MLVCLPRGTWPALPRRKPPSIDRVTASCVDFVDSVAQGLADQAPPAAQRGGGDAGGCCGRCRVHSQARRRRPAPGHAPLVGGAGHGHVLRAQRVSGAAAHVRGREGQLAVEGRDARAHGRAGLRRRRRHHALRAAHEQLGCPELLSGAAIPAHGARHRSARDAAGQVAGAAASREPSAAAEGGQGGLKLVSIHTDSRLKIGLSTSGRALDPEYKSAYPGSELPVSFPQRMP